MLLPPFRAALPSSATRSPRTLRGSHPLRPCIPSGHTLRATTPEGFPLGLLLVRSPLLKKSTFVSSPVLSDMLKSGTSPYASRTIRTAADTGRFSHAVAFVIAGGAYRSHTGDCSSGCVCAGPLQAGAAHNTHSAAACPSVPCKFCGGLRSGAPDDRAERPGKTRKDQERPVWQHIAPSTKKAL